MKEYIYKHILVIKLFLKTSWSIINGKPYKLTLMITDGCNLQCQMCNIWTQEKKYLSLKQMQEMLLNFPSKNLHWLNLSGGETFLNNDLEEFIIWSATNKPGILISFTTNGKIQMSSKLQTFLKTQNQSIIYGLVSLDGPQKLHDDIRGKTDSFKNADNFLTKLKEISHQNPFTQAGVSFTLMEKNYSIAVKFINDFLLRGINVNINLLQNSEYYKIKKNHSFNSHSIGGNNIPKPTPLKICLKKLIYMHLSFNYEKMFRSFFLFIALDRLNGSNFKLTCSSINSNILVHADGEKKLCTPIYKTVNSILNKRNDRKNVKSFLEKQNCEITCLTPCESYLHIHSGLIKEPLKLWTKVFKYIIFLCKSQLSTYK